MTQETLQLTWREAVRKRPAMYMGSTGFQGFIHILKDFFASLYRYIDTTKFAFVKSIKFFDAEKFSFEITGIQSGIFRLDNLTTSIPSNINETAEI